MPNVVIQESFLAPDLATATVRLLGMDGSELVAAGAMACASVGSYQYTRTIALPDGFVQGVLEFSDGTAVGTWRRDFVYMPAVLSGLDGPSSVTLTFEDADGQPVPLVDFVIIGQGPGQADTDGVAAFGLEDGDYTVVARPTNGTLFANYALTVNGTTVVTVSGTAEVLPATSDATKRLVRVQLGQHVTNPDTVIEGVEITALLVYVDSNGNGGSRRVSGWAGGKLYPTATEVETTDEYGIADFEVEPTDALSVPSNHVAAWEFWLDYDTPRTRILLKRVAVPSGVSTTLAALSSV